MDNSNQYLRHRNILGTLGCLLPVLSLLGAALSPNTQYSDWWTSISITYYSSPVLIAILSAVSFFLIIYKGYDKWDDIVNTVAGICGLGVVCFPCGASWVDDATRVGLFWLPIYITEWFHFISAGLLFFLLAMNSMFLFSKCENKAKSRLFKICGWIILITLIIFALNSVIFHLGWTVIVNETIMLLAFGVSWLVKGHVFDRFFKE